MSFNRWPGKKEGGGWLVGTAELTASPQHPASLRWVPIFEWLDEKMKAHVEWVTDLAKAFKKVPGASTMGVGESLAGVERRGRIFLGCRVKGGPPKRTAGPEGNVRIMGSQKDPAIKAWMS